MAITIPLASGPPKRRIIELAFGDLAMAGYEFGRSAEEVNDALDRLEALMHEWPFNRLGYVHRSYGDGEPDELSGIPFETMNAVSAALALRLAAAMGATLSAEAKANLARAMSTLYGYTASVPTMPLARHTPRGAGSEHALSDYFFNETYESENPAEDEEGA